LPDWVNETPFISLPATEKLIHTQLRPILEKDGMTLVALTDVGTNQSAWGVEYRTVPFGKNTLVPMVNYLNRPLSVRLDMKGNAVDLLTGEPVDLSSISLESLCPRLLTIQP
jgi:hypothetical protein